SLKPDAVSTGQGDSFYFSPDGRVFTAAIECEECEFRDVTSGKKMAAIKPIKGGGFYRRKIFSTYHRLCGTQQFMSNHVTPEITLWETATGRKLYSFVMAESPPVFVFEGDGQGHEVKKTLKVDGVPPADNLVAFTQDGRLILTQNDEFYGKVDPV